jgi:hypothetical protein
MKVVYLAHPYSGDKEANIASAKRCLRWIYDNHPDVVVLCMWVLDCEVLDDDTKEHRELGLVHDRAIIPLCEEFWVFGYPKEITKSDGMGEELEIALDNGLEIVDRAGLDI